MSKTKLIGLEYKMKSLHDLEASLAVISSNEAVYRGGNLHAYRPIAVELRKLLCDSQAKTDISLVKRIFPDFKLHPLSGNQNLIDEHTTLYIPGQMSFDGKGESNFSELFNEFRPTMMLDDWLEQKLFDISTTIRDFIRSVADKEGAHSDKSYNAVLHKTKSVFLSNDTLVAKTITVIGRYVVKVIAIRLVNENISEIGAHIISEFNRAGRGIAVLDLTEFAARSLQGIPIKYEPASKVEAYFKRDPNKCETAMRILQNYKTSQCFLLLIIELNGELWLYQQAFKTKK